MSTERKGLRQRVRDFFMGKEPCEPSVAEIAEAGARIAEEARMMGADPRVCTTSGEPPSEVRARQTAETGMFDSYLILCDEERAKGFVKPYRNSYRHVGPPGPVFPLRDLTAEERERWGDEYAKYEPYPEGYMGSALGHLWTQEALDSVRKGCGSVTTMGRSIAETYARDPYFYGGTFCVRCNRHLPLSEFVWEPDGEPMDPRDPAWKKPS